MYSMKYGSGKIKFDYPEEDVVRVIEPNKISNQIISESDIVKKALHNPIASARLSAIVKEGDTVAVIVPDITRGWQSPDIYVPPVIEELNLGGVRDEDILIISATGSHRAQTDEEYIKLVSKDIFNRIKIVDHDCKDDDNLVYVGTTSRGTHVTVNKQAIERDHIVTTGGAIYHFLAGFGGGRKYILPGITGYDTIMKNHSYALNEGEGSGSNEFVKMGNMTPTNPIHSDIMEAASFVRPTFNLNVVVDSNKGITHAFSGNYIKSHEAAVEVVKQVDGVNISEKAELVIASACGFPKDINLYQTSKTLFNTIEAVEDGGAMIILSECREGFGSGATEKIIKDYDNMLDREKELRRQFTIGGFIGYRMCEYAEKVTFVLVSDMAPEELKTTKIHAARTIEEAIELVHKLTGKTKMRTFMMPYAANTFPILE